MDRVIKRSIAVQRIKHITKLIKTRNLQDLQVLSHEHIPATEAVIPFNTNMRLDSLPSDTILNTINQPFYRFHEQDTYILGD